MGVAYNLPVRYRVNIGIDAVAVNTVSAKYQATGSQLHGGNPPLLMFKPMISSSHLPASIARPVFAAGRGSSPN